MAKMTENPLSLSNLKQIHVTGKCKWTCQDWFTSEWMIVAQ